MEQNTKNNIKDKFNANARQYDPQRNKLIPCFNDFYSIPVALLQSENNAPSILDIGAGTGLLSAFVKEKYPRSTNYVNLKRLLQQITTVLDVQLQQRLQHSLLRTKHFVKLYILQKILSQKLYATLGK